MGDVEKGKKTSVQKGAQCHTVGKGGKHKHPLGRGDTDGVFGESQKNIPGTKMIFAGIQKAGEGADLMAYIKKAPKES